ncbi:class I SAM-dependent methyltransferase [Actinocatenispora rupis]|uniref:Methyltransferase type 12 n=1 Tax=Actinocatenispora rupis TaxID=519421 RepID=A0A8J3J7Q1_9ACTN|nr:methyltransferase domain-containing protein [Actinocatenispora rupis]GID10933.1 methyltransferase type 12 [Actinocatenispora rupis]
MTSTITAEAARPAGDPSPPDTPTDLYAAALAVTAAGGRAELAVGAGHRWSTVDIEAWTAGPGAADRTLLERCAGATLDVGCGPGRLTAAVAATGTPALGIDTCATAVRLARARGADALHRSVYARLPGTGRWRHVLLADGNIGIGGDPYRLLDRCRRLVAPTGTILVEVGAPGTATARRTLRLRHGGRHSHPFPWAYVSVTDLPRIADATALRVLDRWSAAGRWFATVAPR